MKYILASFVAAAILIGLISLLIYPTMYYYTYMGDRHNPLKINRWTGEVLFYNTSKGVWEE